MYVWCDAHIRAPFALSLSLSRSHFIQGNYVPVVRSGNLLYLCGHLPKPVDGDLMVGKVGLDFTTEEAYTAAQLCGLNMIATMKSALRLLASAPMSLLVVSLLRCVSHSPRCYRSARSLSLSLSPHTAELGDLDRVKRIVKVVGFVNCVDGFAAQPTVVNGCSDLMAEVFGERGVHARSAVRD